MRLRRPGLRRRLHAAGQALADSRHRLGLARLGRSASPEYRRYLRVQLRRSLSKRENDPGVGMRFLVSRVCELAEPGPVLCIGSRNTNELEEFRAHGFHDVVGVDLFSQHPDIRVMDMHALRFADDSFGVVFSSHSLEHAYDVGRVAGEIARVGRAGAVVGVEVPVRVRASEADRVEFSGLDELRGVFEPWLAKELWAEEQPARSETNDQGTEVARLVFRLGK